MRLTTMPADANPYGDIFGGWLMCQMDMAAGLAAARRVRGRAVTVAADGMTFIRSVAVGDEVSVYAQVIKVGRTSIRIGVEAWRRPREGELEEKVTEANFTFVAVDENNRPVVIEAGGETPD
jgi:acyl-CoA thioesterase YciA